MYLRSRVLLTSSLLAATAPTAPPPLGNKHVDERIGYGLAAPRRWDKAPVAAGEDWIVAQYVSDRVYSHSDMVTGRTHEHRPDMRVIALLHARVEAMEAAQRERDPKEESERIPRDYLGYLNLVHDGRGFYVAGRGTRKHDGLSVQTYEIEVQGGFLRPARRLIAWSYPTEVGEVVVQFEMLQDAPSKLESMAEKTLESFEVIERSGEPLLPGVDPIWASDVALARLPARERWLKRKDQERDTWARLQADLPESWTATVIHDVPVLDHGDPRKAKAAATRVRAILDWLDGVFPEVGPEEFVRSPVLRIYGDRTEVNAALRGSEGWRGIGREIILHSDTTGGLDALASRWLSMRTVEVWFHERDRQLYWAMPWWLKSGLQSMVQGADLKRRKLKFVPSPSQRSLQDADALPCRELMRMTRDEARGELLDLGAWARATAQSGALTRYLLDGPGSKKKETRGVVGEYLRNLQAVIERFGVEGSDGIPTDADEEDRYWKEIHEALEKYERNMATSTFARTFGEWSSSDWSDFDAAFRRYL